jgi:hypothetical protein
MQKLVPLLVENAQVHPLGVQIHATIELVLSVVNLIVVLLMPKGSIDERNTEKG